MNDVTNGIGHFAIILVRPDMPREIVVRWDSLESAVRSANRLNEFANENRVLRSYIVEKMIPTPIDNIVGCP